MATDELAQEDEIDDWAVGYHYTSWSNWLIIREQGLKPTLLSEDKIRTITPKAIDGWDGRGVWIWVNRLSAVEHMGSLIYQLAKRNEDRLVHLRIWYPNKIRLLPNSKYEEGSQLGLLHTGKIDGYLYHARTKSCLLTSTVPPQDIELLRIYDLVELLK